MRIIKVYNPCFLLNKDKKTLFDSRDLLNDPLPLISFDRIVTDSRLLSGSSRKWVWALGGLRAWLVSLSRFFKQKNPVSSSQAVHKPCQNIRKKWNLLRSSQFEILLLSFLLLLLLLLLGLSICLDLHTFSWIHIPYWWCWIHILHFEWSAKKINLVLG